jgi:Fic family protein
MITMKLFISSPPMIPPAAAWYLSDLGEAFGKQELFTRQSPQKLKTLREHALIESAVSSNRLEGVTVDRSRIATVVFGKSLLRDRDEAEVRGYGDALKLIHESGRKLEINEDTVRQLHTLARANIGDAGSYKEKDSDIIERFPDGRERVRFKTVPAKDTPGAMKDLVKLWNQGMEERRIPPPVLLAAWNLDFLCIHPFRDGNGRVSRLLLLLQSYHLGYEVGKYISIERHIEQNKDRYYETLEQSSRGWHEKKHDPWPYINFILFTFKEVYKELEERVGQLKSPRGAKTELILAAIAGLNDDFSIGDVQAKCPGVSVDMIRRVLKKERRAGTVECLGRGRDAKWRRIKPKPGNTQLNG